MSGKSGRSSRRAGKLLFVTYFFPPTAGGGVFRPLATVKYLSRLGWDITVITGTTPRHYPTDPGLERQIPKGVEIIRLPVVWEGSWTRRVLGRLNLDWIPKHLVTPDERIFWAEKAASRARKLMREGGFACMYTTGPPFSILVAGLWLKREFKVPWLAEFRDPWTLAPYLSIPNPHQRRFAGQAESDLAELADAIVMVTPTFARMMKEKYPSSAARVRCVPNGFDAEDFADLPSIRTRNELCTVVASGTVFGRYNMDDLLKGLIELRKGDRPAYEKLKVLFQGLPDARLNRRLLESDLHDRCSSRGFVAHRENIRDLLTADLLVLPLADVPNSAGHIPSRAYEYLASGTPILAICPDGDMRDLVGGFPEVRLVRPGDVTGVVESLKDAVSRWERGASPSETDPNLLRSLTREARAKELDAILREITGKGGAKA